MEEQRVRISDIAEELGLSTATVSNVIHGKTKKISDETVSRVMALIEEREYLPHMADVLLARNPAKIIGVFINDHEKYEGHTLDDVFIASSLNHLSTEIERSGQFMMVKKTKTAEDILRFSSMWNMEGVVVIGFCEQDYLYLRSHMRIPFVVYDGICETPERFVNLTIDNYDGGRQLGVHLRALGHTRALCLSDNDIGSDHERCLGFAEGFAPYPAELLLIPMQREARHDFYRQQRDRLCGVTAIFAVSDYYALDLLAWLHTQGIAVPDAISVAGFDDIPMCEMVCPTLTSIRQDGAKRARLAIESLAKLKAKQQPQAVIRLPVTLVCRGSTAAPAASAADS